MKTRDKIIIVFSFLFVSILGVFLSLSKKMEENNITNKSKYGSVSGNFGEWELTSYMESSSSNVSIDGNNVTYYRNSDPLEDNEIDLHFNTKIVQNNISSINLGSMYYYINTSSLFFSDSEYTDFSINEEENRVEFMDSDELKGYIKFGSDLPYCNFDDVSYDISACGGEANFYWFYNNYGLMITNGKEIDNLDSYSVDLKVTYALNSDFSLIAENLEVYNSFEVIDYVDSYYEYDVINSTVTDKANPLDLSNINSESEEEYTEWQSEWGENNTSFDRFVVYPVIGYIQSSRSVNLSFELDGTYDIVAYSSDGESFSTTSYNEFVDNNLCGIQGSGYLDVNCYVVVGYNATTEDQDVEFGLKVVDDLDSKSFTWRHTIPAKEISVVTYPEGINKDIIQINNTLNAGDGAINKINSDNDVTFSWLMESSSSDITDGNKAFNLWNIIGDDGYTISISSEKAEIDTDYSSVVNPSELSSDDYNIVSFYPKDDAEFDYEQKNDKYVLVKDNNYGNYTPKKVYASIDNGDYELIGTYVNSNGVIIYTPNDDRTVENNNVSESNPVELPQNVTRIKVEYSGNRAGVYLGVNINVVLKGTDSIKNIIQDKGDTVVLKNVAGVQLNSNPIEYNRIGTYLTRLEVKSFSNSTAIVNDKINDGKSDLITFNDNFYEQLNYTEENKDEALSIINEQKNGVVYELLPVGAELYNDVSVKTYGNNGTCEASKELTDNYLGTGRVLLKITIGECSSNYYDSGVSIQSGYSVSFDVTYSALANQTYGTVLNKDVMYVASEELGNGYDSSLDAPSSLFSDNDVKNTFADLATGNGNLLFATTSAEVEALSISVGTYSKETKKSEDTSYSNNSSVIESKKYSYKLQYAFTSDLEEITNVVFIDKLESDYGTNKHFNGYLDSVDITNLTSIGVDAKVYYAIGDVNTEVFDVTQWSETKPDDISNLKAIAVACGSFVFKRSNNVAPTVYVNMVAPNGYEQDIKAYNKSNIIYKNVGNPDLKSLDSEITTVDLNKAEIGIDGKSNFGKGTQSQPAAIDGDLSYEIIVNNNDSENDFKDVVVQIAVPEGLKIVNPASNENTITYTIDNLEAGSTNKIEIGLELNEPASGDKVYKGSYKIISMNGHDYKGTEGYIYNKVDLPTVEAHKYAKTADTNSFSDIAGMLVKKDEEFTYRIALENTSGKPANNVTVVDTIPEGLTLVESSIGTGVVSDDKITWVVDVDANSVVNIDYKVKLNSDETLGTTYRSSAHVTLVNPLLDNDILYDEDTNVISILYQIASSVKISNALNGDLADSNKEFEYVVEFNGTSANSGNYDLFDTNNNSLGSLTLDADGQGSYSFKLKGKESITFKNLTGGINYSIKQKIYKGYSTVVGNSQTGNEEYVITNGNTNEEGTATYAFTNTYSASGSAVLNAKVTYDKDIEDNMFKLSIDGTELAVSSDGSVDPVQKSYSNKVGQFTYVIKQINTNLNKISYDSKEYKAVVNVTDDGEGTLNTQVTYYDNDKTIDEVVFKNTYLPNGLKISNVNNSEYIDKEKIFTYDITLTNGEGTYEVKDSKNNKLTNIEFVNGTANYSVNLLSNESILISDLPDGVDYVIKQRLVEYYESTASEEYELDEENISIGGTTTDGSKEIQFNNKYETKASFEPNIKVLLEGKVIEEEEFTFKLLDVSEGSTHGYTVNAKNDVDGVVMFDEIEFTKPGTYKYEIVQLDNGSNHIYFDFSKVYLVLNLTDNGDGTMEVLGTYEYENKAEYLLNKYSVDPIVKEEEVEKDDRKNPNTNDRIRNITILLLVVLLLFGVERWVRRRRYKMNV